MKTISVYAEPSAREMIVRSLTAESLARQDKWLLHTSDLIKQNTVRGSNAAKYIFASFWI